ncbi:MAG TPA: hypothetical protein VIY51_00925, partial [Xanthobacteraceae bacterium]
RTGTDGGMNPVFLAAVQLHGGTTFPIQSNSSVPGTIPANIRPPGPAAAPETTGSTTGNAMSLASSESRPVPAPRTSAQPGSAQPSSGGLFGGLFASNGESAKSNDSQSGGGVLDRMSRLVGLGGSDQGGDTAAAKSKPAAKPTQTASASAAPARPKPAAGAAAQPGAAQPEVKSATAAPGKPPTAPQTPTDTQQEAVNTANLLRGAQATVPAGSFDTRWGSMR